MGTTRIGNLNKQTAVLTRNGELLEGINYAQYRAGVQPQKETVVEEETIEQKKERLMKELEELNALE